MEDVVIDSGELRSLPIVDSEEFESTLHIRLHHASSLNDIWLFLGKTFKKFIVSVEKEGTPEQHFHMVVPWEKKLTEVGDYLRTYDPLIKGNKCFSASWMKNKNLFSYVVKEGNYKTSGFSTKEISEFKKVSYQKYSKEEFATKLNKLVDDYLLSHKDKLDDFIMKFIDLKVSYKQIIDLSYIQKYALMVECKKNQNLSAELSIRVFNKIYELN